MAKKIDFHKGSVFYTTGRSTPFHTVHKVKCAIILRKYQDLFYYKIEIMCKEKWDE